MNAPKFLLLFPTASYNGAPAVYGMIPFYERKDVTRLFDTLRAYLKTAVELVKSTAKIHENPLGELWAWSIFDKLVADSHPLYFLHAETTSDFETSVNGVEDLETLLRLTATNLLRPSADVADMLSRDSSEDWVPVAIDFHAWYEVCRANGYYSHGIDEFWEVIEELGVRTENETTEVHIPRFLKVLRARKGHPPEFNKLTDQVKLVYRSQVKHSDNDEFVTEEIPLAKFIGAYEDALSRF